MQSDRESVRSVKLVSWNKLSLVGIKPGGLERDEPLTQL